MRNELRRFKMLELHPQFIKDAKGKKTHVVISLAEFEQIIERLEDLEDLEEIIKVKEEEVGMPGIPFREYVAMRDSKLVEV